MTEAKATLIWSDSDDGATFSSSINCDISYKAYPSAAECGR